MVLSIAGSSFVYFPRIVFAFSFIFRLACFLVRLQFHLCVALRTVQIFACIICCSFVNSVVMCIILIVFTRFMRCGLPSFAFANVRSIVFVCKYQTNLYIIVRTNLLMLMPGGIQQLSALIGNPRSV